MLDVSCGLGSITVGFAACIPGGSVTGVHLLDEVILQAHEHLVPRASIQNIGTEVELHIGNVVQGLAFENSMFDVVFCNQTLLHISSPGPSLR